MWFLFAPGAGAPSTSSWMSLWSDRLSRFGTVIRFDYPYRLGGRKFPDPKEVLVAHHRSQWEAAVQDHGSAGVLVGKSLGSRVGLVVGATAPALGAVCFGYPLLSQNGKRERREELLGYPGPLLLVQGTRDALCPLPLLEEVLRQRRGPTDLCVVDGGDHSLTMTKTALRERGLTEEAVGEVVTRRLETFLEGLAPGGTELPPQTSSPRDGVT